MKYIPVPLSKKEAMRKKKKLAIAKTGSHKGRGKKVAKLANPLLNIDDFDSADMTTAVAEIQTGELPAAFHLASRELKTLITCICLTYNVETKSREEISSKLGMINAIFDRIEKLQTRDDVLIAINERLSRLENKRDPPLPAFSTPPPVAIAHSYASVANATNPPPIANKKTTVAPVAAKPPRPAVLVFPNETSEQSSSIETQQTMRRAFIPANSGIHIKGVHPIRGAGILVRPGTMEEAKTFAASKELRDAGLRAILPEPRNPEIVILGLDQEDMKDSKSLISAVISNIEEEVNPNEVKAIKLIKTNKMRGDLLAVVLAVPPSVRHRLIEKRRISIGWSFCRVRDNIATDRCFRCQQYGHFRARCTAPAEICIHCATPGHRGDECPKKDKEDFKPNCATCVQLKKPDDHQTGTEACTAFLRSKQKMVSRINYG